MSIRGLVEDSSGLRSGEQSTALQVSGGAGSGIPISELGDTLTSVQDAGLLQVPCSFSGNIHTTGLAAGYADIDIVAFTVGSTGTGANLSWTGTGDYDVYLFDELGFTFLSVFDGDLTWAAASGDNSGNTPESVNYPLLPGEVYYLLVGGWDGPGGDYTMTVR